MLLVNSKVIDREHIGIAGQGEKQVVAWGAIGFVGDKGNLYSRGPMTYICWEHCHGL